MISKNQPIGKSYRTIPATYRTHGVQGLLQSPADEGRRQRHTRPARCRQLSDQPRRNEVRTVRDTLTERLR